jgi:hypothetical protein
MGEVPDVFISAFAAARFPKYLGPPRAVDELSLAVDARGAGGFFGANGDYT